MFLHFKCLNQYDTLYSSYRRPDTSYRSSKFNNWRQCKCGVSNENKDTEHITPEGRIINGQNAVKNEFPWLVNIWVRKYHLIYFNESCSGSIISTKTIITAAHCLYEDQDLLSLDRISIIVSDHDTSKPRDGDFVVQACSTTPHPDFDVMDQSRDYDIGFITLCKELTWSKFVSPICLPDKNYDYEAREAIVAGWGFEKLNDPKPNNKILQKVKQITWTNAKCVDRTWVDQTTLSNRQICAAYEDVSTCNNDDGGPLMVQDPDTKAFTLVGIVSRRAPNCETHPDEGNPQIYQRVQAEDYEQAISDNILGTQCEKGKFSTTKNCPIIHKLHIIIIDI